MEGIQIHSLRKRPTAAILDFDGTLSLLRRDWQGVMIPMMVEILRQTPTSESDQQLTSLVEDFVARLTGKQTIYQMIRLAEEVARRGGHPETPLHYKHLYHDRLWQDVSRRIDGVRNGSIPLEQMTVRGSHQLLKALSHHQLSLYLASGTDLNYVQDELQVLQLDSFFGPHVYGALDDYRSFSKAQVIQSIIQQTGSGDQLLGIGDGYVEIEEVKRVGGFAVGVASFEDGRPGMNPWKRDRLVEAGADVIIADYSNLEELLSILQLGEVHPS